MQDFWGADGREFYFQLYLQYNLSYSNFKDTGTSTILIWAAKGSQN